jgi:hypothetical protein
MAAPYVGNPDFRGYLNYLSQNTILAEMLVSHFNMLAMMAG